MPNTSYGTWSSPITPEWAAASQTRFNEIRVDGEDIYWDEMRPQEGGRTTIFKRSKNGEIHEVLPPPFSARSRVLEYGGEAFTVSQGKLYFVHEKEECIYVDGKPLTASGTRFADLHVVGDHLLAIGQHKEELFIASIDLKSGAYTKLATGHDFFTSLAVSPDQNKLAFLAWDLPHMPWSSTTLWVADYAPGKLTNLQKIAGGQNESIFQPQWSPAGVLHFVSDKSGWWNLYCFSDGKIEPLCPKEAEFGLPQWVLGLSTYTFIENKIWAAYQKSGLFHLASFPPLQEERVEGTYFSQLRSTPSKIVCHTGSFTEGKKVVLIDPHTPKIEVLAHPLKFALDPSDISTPEFLSFPTQNGRIAHGFYYPPKNKDFSPLPGELPPLLLKIHGGPTACAPNTFDLKIQYWTSRGFAVFDLDYGGSTGYGRAFRSSLQGSWGVVDVEDGEAAVRFLLKQKKGDPRRVFVSGSSAGGFTALKLAASSSLFAACASYYGICDLVLLAGKMHKFEAPYLEYLLTSKEFLEARSPLFSADKIQCPVIFFQGGEDKIVPLEQAESMHEALLRKHLLTELIVFPEEQHGFRKAENIRFALEKELDFYLKQFSAHFS